MPTGRLRSKATRATGKTSRREGVEMAVVYVHGIGRQPEPAALKLEWDLALFGRDMGQRTRMAYWADLLHGTDYAEPSAVARSAAGRIDVRAVLRAANVDEPKAVSFAEDLAGMLGGDLAGAGQRKKVLPLPGFLRRTISRIFLETFIADTAAYFFKPGMRKKIQERLREAFPSAGTSLAVVAHSQGSIIALEVLAEAATLDVRQFVTIGSPLGITEIQDLLSCSHFVPDSVKRWHNFADPFDPVALDKSLGNDFEPRGAIDDEILVNPRRGDLGRSNPHSAVRYLSHPKVRAVVHTAVCFDSMSRFVVARDVAERLGTAGRHPVLIEILEPTREAVGEEPAETLRHERDVELGQSSLVARINRAASQIESMVSDPAAARVDRLRHFVAAHLTAPEIRQVAAGHQTLRVYAVWRSSTKRKLLWRSGKVLQADAARVSYGATGRGITWTVLDTGVQANHPHFAGSPGRPTIIDVWDCTKPGAPQNVKAPADKDGHGTHVSGIIAGADPNPPPGGFVRSGLAPETRLVVYKVLDDKGLGEDAWIIKALDHIAAHNEDLASSPIHGINLSLGGPFDSSIYGCGYSPLCQELRRLWRSGVFVVVACGNEGVLEIQTTEGDVELNTVVSIGDPANLDDCIAVGSVNADKPHLYGISSFSSRGPTADGRPKPDVVAPGERISSCNAQFSGPMTLYREESGTSMAAPHVSGLLAAFLSVRREFTGRPDEVKRILLDSCIDLGRDRYHQGKGLPNLMQMLLSV